MGLTEPRIYLDSCIAIYLVEEHQVFAPPLETLLEGRPDADIYVSDLAVMECLVRPFAIKIRHSKKNSNGGSRMSLYYLLPVMYSPKLLGFELIIRPSKLLTRSI